MWIYIQTTGELISPHGEIVCTGYSGNGEWKNDPAAESVKGHGPIPAGRWKIGFAFRHPTKGPCCMRLAPSPRTELFGRDGFMAHGDSIAHPGTASDGCIIQPFSGRKRWSESPDRDLLVVKDRAAIPA